MGQRQQEDYGANRAKKTLTDGIGHLNRLLTSYYVATRDWLTSVRRLSQARSPQLDANAPQPFAEKVLAPPEPDPEIPFQADMRSGHDERALARADTFGKSHAGKRRLVLDQRDRARFRFPPGKPPAEALDPRTDNRQIVGQNLARSRVTSLTIQRLDGDPRDAVGHFVRTNGEIVVLRPALLGQ